MAETSIQVAGLVVTHNSSHVLRACLASLVGQGLSKIVVIDSGSSANEVSSMRAIAAGFRCTRFITCTDNLGYGGALNRGAASLSLSPNDVLLFTNPDCVASPFSVARLLEALVATGADFAGPAIFRPTPRGGTRLWACEGKIATGLGVTQMRRGRWGRRRKTVREVGFLTGAFMVARAAAFEALGGFDERFFMYWEDADLSRRAGKAGMRLVCVSNAEVMHRVGQSATLEPGRPPHFFYYMQRNRIRFFCPPLREAVFMFGPQALYTVLLLIWPLFQRTNQLPAFRASCAGLRAGLRGRFRSPSGTSYN